MSRLLSLLTLTLTMMMLTGCGGGGGPANENPPGAVTIHGNPEVAVVQAEMIKDVTPSTIPITATITSNLDDVNQTAGTVNLERYTINYTRRDGGVTIDPVEGQLGHTIALTGNAPNALTFDIVAMHSGDKLYSAFAQDFLADPRPITFDCSVTLHGRTVGGETKRATFGFVLEVGAFEPNDSLIPNVTYLFQTISFLYPNDYMANWLVEGQVDDGIFFLPWSQSLILQPTDFPLGAVSVSSAVLNLLPGFTYTGDSGVLFVSNRYGSSMSANDDEITITALPEIIPDPPASVDILQFYPSQTTINLGDSVTLNWVVTGEVDSLEILPEAFDGVTVDFSDKDLTFGSVTIRPTETVRPILKAKNSVSEDTVFLSEPITVVEPADTNEPPTIDFFLVDKDTVNLGRSVVFYWNISGTIDRVELFPFNGNIFDVTDLTSLVSPPFIETGDVTFSLVAFGVDGSIARSEVTVTVEETFNLPVTVELLQQQPGASIANQSDGSFTFQIQDPERRDCSWKVSKIAGDGASFFPRDGEVPEGIGPGTVAISDYVDSDNGFLTFLVEAWDDDIFGFSGAATKDVLLVNYTTTGVLSDTAPSIDTFDFTPTGPDTAPGTEGSLTFSFSDEDNLDLRWTLLQVAGDVGGSLSQTTGTVDNGLGQVQVTYADDPDTPTDNVVFLLRVEERNTQNPQFTISTLQVNKGDGAVDGGTATNTGEAIGFPLAALYGNFTGDPDSASLLSDRTIYFNGDLSDPQFFQNPDLSGELVGLSFVVDLSHESNEPGAITDALFERSFQVPSNSEGNEGNLVFVNYFPSAGERTGGTATPTTGYVARFRMTFTVEDFRPTAGDALNLPTAGSMTYSLAVTGVDTSTNLITLNTDITVTVPTP